MALTEYITIAGLVCGVCACGRSQSPSEASRDSKVAIVATEYELLDGTAPLLDATPAMFGEITVGADAVEMTIKALRVQSQHGLQRLECSAGGEATTVDLGPVVRQPPEWIVISFPAASRPSVHCAGESDLGPVSFDAGVDGTFDGFNVSACEEERESGMTLCGRTVIGTESGMTAEFLVSMGG